jgi:hypothetical protein
MSEHTEHILEYVDAYFHDLLTPAEDEAIEQHCDQCPACDAALEEAKKRYDALQTVPASEASEKLVQATLEQVEAAEKAHARRMRRLRRGALLALAASVLLLGAVHLYYLNLSPSPYDLQVFGQDILLADTEGSLRVRVLDHKRGKAAENIPVRIDLEDARTGRTVHLAHFTTDAQGTGQPRFRLPNWKDGEYRLRVTAETGRPTERVTQKVRLTHLWKLMLSSDRPVYQPGQEIRLRALALRSLDLKPVAGQGAVFTISDPKGNVIFKHRGTTSKFGLSAADCPLATEILEGAYTVRCQVGDTESALAVEVKKYVLPKFKVELKPDRPHYQPGQAVAGKLTAAYFFGKPVAGGEVELKLTSGEQPPKVQQWLRLRADDKGEAAFTFPPLPLSLADDARLDLRATVTDTAGQKHERTTSLLVSKQPLRIAVVPEAGSLVRGLPNTLYVLVTTPDGQPVKARLKIPGVAKEVTTSDLGVASFEVTPDSFGLNGTIEARDDQGRSCRHDVQMPCGPLIEDFLVRTDRAVYRGGDTVRLVALGGGRAPVFLDFIKDGQTVLTDTVKMADGRGEARFDLPPELFGTVRLCAYRFGSAGQLVRKMRVLYIHPASQLTIGTTTDRPEHRPGGTAKVAFTLKDRQGNPVVGALSLAGVDEAVFSVLERAPGMEQVFYTVDQWLMQPASAVSSCSPVWSGDPASPQQQQFAQALLAHTAHTEAVDPEADAPRSMRAIDRQGQIPSQLGVHSLSSSSFPLQQTEFEAKRKAVLARIRVVWIFLGVGLVFAAYLALWYFLKVWAVVLHAGAFILLCVWSGSREPHRDTDRSYFGILKTRRAWQFNPADGPVVEFLDGSGSIRAGDWDGDGSLDVRFRTFWFGIQDGTSNTILMRDRIIRSIGKRTTPPSRLVLQRDIRNANWVERDQVSPPRVREWFPETLLWRPELITDDRGRATLDIDLADSITTWRLTASAVTADGRLGASQSSLKVFQPFFVDVNLPVALTRGDEVSVPVVLYNYLDRPQRVTLRLAAAPWFEGLDPAEQALNLKAREVRSTFYRIRVRKVGTQHMQVTAAGSGAADAIKRRVEVLPDGRRVETVWNGTLRQPVRIQLAVPKDAIEGSPRLLLKLYPSRFSQLLEGLDSIFRLPYGCFEQTSSTTYPNVLALDYLRRSGKSLPAVEAKARHYIHLGYQRLLGFEVEGGGFDWFGRPPANRTLTAYGLMEFRDMAKVHDVDPRLIERTRKWLLDCRQTNGSWEPEGHAPAGLPTGGVQGDQLARLSTTAYVAWAVFAGPTTAEEARPTRDFLLTHRPADIHDPHALALVCNALLVLDPSGRDAVPYLGRLEALKRTADSRRLAWWEQPEGGRTTFHGSGRGGSVETTALAALALLKANPSSATANSALAWLTEQRDPAGTWHSTQATVLALKALLAGTDAGAGKGERRIAVTVDGKRRDLIIPADQAEVMKQVDLSGLLTPGEHVLTLAESSGTVAGYQVAFRYHEPGEQRRPDEPLSIRVAYAREKLQVGETLQATASVTNRTKTAAPMVMLDLPVPAGFHAVAEDFAELVKAGTVAKFQTHARGVLVYLRDLAPGKGLELRYGLRADMPVRVTVPAARVYEYYDPDRQGFSRVARLTVIARQ